jgi:hypothetical protein
VSDSTADISPGPPWARAVFEAPFLVGLLGGWVLLWLRGGLFVLDGTVQGYHWPEWLHNSWHVVHGRWDRMSGFRKPLHGYLQGMLGEAIGYDDAAIVVSSVSGLVMVAAAGLLGRVLGGPAAGGLAAFSLGAVPLVANSVHWGNGYPLLAATTGAALASAVLLAARPSRSALALVTLSHIGVLATEDRGVLVMPWLLAMSALAWRKSPAIPRFAWVVAAVAIGAIPPTIDYGLGHRAPFALTAEGKRKAQQEVVVRWLRIEPAPTLVETCKTIRQEETLVPAFFTTPCARAVLQYNSQTIAPKATFFSASALAAALLVWTAGPGRRRRKLVWAGVGTGGVAWLVFGAATPMPHRYILQFTVPLAVLVPVALGRIGQLAGRGWRGWGLATTLCAVALGFGWRADPHDRNGPWQRTRGDWSEAAWAQQAALVEQHVPADEAVLDCADHGINSALLPAHVTGPAPFLSPNAGFCIDWVTDPTRFGAARRWVVVSTTEALFDKGKRQRVRLDTEVARTDGWSKVDGSGDIQLWVRDH